MKEIATDTDAGRGISRRSFLARGGAFAFAAAVTGPGLTILSGCGGSASAEPLTFMQFYGPGGDVGGQSRWFQDLVEDWNGQNETKVRLQYVPPPTYISGTRLQTAFSSGEGPDIFIISPGDFLRYYNGGVLADLTPHLSKAAVDDFFPDALATRSVGGKVYALPMEVEPLAMFYSEKVWEDAGLSEGDIPTTWDQLFDVAGKLRGKGRAALVFETGAGYYQNFTWYPWMWQGGGEVVDGKGRSVFRSKPVEQALELFASAVREGLAPRTLPAAGDLVTAIGAGQAGIWQSGIWQLAAFKQNAPKTKYGAFKLPVPPGGEYTTDLGGWAFVANAKGRDPESAAEFCAWALGSTEEHSVKRVAEWCTVAKSDVAPRRSVLEYAERQGGYDDPMMRYFKDEVFPGGRAEPRYPPVVYKSVSDAIQGAMLAGQSPASAASTAHEAIEAYMASYEGARLI